MRRDQGRCRAGPRRRAERGRGTARENGAPPHRPARPRRTTRTVSRGPARPSAPGYLSGPPSATQSNRLFFCKKRAARAIFATPVHFSEPLAVAGGRAANYPITLVCLGGFLTPCPRNLSAATGPRWVSLSIHPRLAGDDPEPSRLPPGAAEAAPRTATPCLSLRRSTRHFETRRPGTRRQGPGTRGGPNGPHRQTGTRQACRFPGPSPTSRCPQAGRGQR